MFSETLDQQGSALELAAGAFALAWSVDRLRYSPTNPRIWTLSGSIAAEAARYALKSPLLSEPLNFACGSYAVRLMGSVLLLLFNFLLLAFFLHVSEQTHRLRVHTALWLTASVALIVLGGFGALDQVADPTQASLATPLFGMDIGLYSGYATLLNMVLAWRYARVSHSPLSTGLRILSLSLGVSDVAGTLGGFIGGQLAYQGHPLPVWLQFGCRWAVNIGLVGQLTGAVYPGVAHRARALKRHQMNLRRYRELEPLWNALNTAFPNTRLQPAPDPTFTDRFTWRSAQRRYYRRAMEIRDGLVAISPRLPADFERREPSEQAAALQEALWAGDGDDHTGLAVLVAAPTAPGMEADTAALITLSRAVADLGRADRPLNQPRSTAIAPGNGCRQAQTPPEYRHGGGSPPLAS